MQRHIINNAGDLRVVTVGGFMGNRQLASSVRTLDHGNFETVYKDANALDYLLENVSLFPLDNVEEMYMSTKGSLLDFRYTLTDDLGIPPKRARPSDSGFNLSLIGIRQQIGKVVLYERVCLSNLLQVTTSTSFHKAI